MIFQKYSLASHKLDFWGTNCSFYAVASNENMFAENMFIKIVCDMHSEHFKYLISVSTRT